ncbi:hypothetical protein QYE76_019236 [Lolium multiflorum]|uniref:Transposase (putative) gypsy type domain-containing protein n=1 Tax=Lolium multiflorum TaxID=4521 RepID=A0AAD8R5B4_LOLMU|nr:hypothetical protein QYE76_019236 [Lolium multiflorum]
METETGRDQEAGSSSQAPGTGLSGITRGAWRGSDVTQHEIDWLYRSRRIPEGVSCRLPDDEIEPVLRPGEYVVFLAHFERGFGLPASDFLRQFLDFYELQPHHLPGNAVFYLSCYATFMEAYIGIRPTRETFARFFSLRINSVQGKDIPKPKPPVQCGSCIIGSRQGSPFFKFTGLESCRLWQETFFYVKNDGDADLINLPAFNPAPPSKINWNYSPGVTHIETNRVVRFMEKLMKETNICSDDIIRAFISRRVLPLKRRAHKMSEMYGPGDPTKITGLLLARRTPRTASPASKRIGEALAGSALWTGWTLTHTFINAHSASTQPQVHEHVAPLDAEAGDEFVEKLAPQGKKNKAPAPDAGTSQSPPPKRFRTEVPRGRSKRRYKGKQMPVASGPALKLGPRPESSEGTDTGANNTGAEPLPGGRNLRFLPSLKRRRRRPPLSSPPSRCRRRSPRRQANGATPTPPPQTVKITEEKATASGISSADARSDACRPRLRSRGKPSASRAGSPNRAEVAIWDPCSPMPKGGMPRDVSAPTRGP